MARKVNKKDNFQSNQFNLFTGEVENNNIDIDFNFNKQVEGKTFNDKLNHINDKIYAPPPINIEEYCTIILEWLRINQSAYSILDFYEDDANSPFIYHLSETEKDIRINKLLEHRISRDAAKGILRGTIVQDMMKNLYSWRDKNIDTVNDSSDITFELSES